MSKKIRAAIEEGNLMDFNLLFNKYNARRKLQILNRARFLQAAIELRKLRQKMQITQSDLAKKMRVEREYVARIESGNQNITLETLYKIAEATKTDFVFGFK